MKRADATGQACVGEVRLAPINVGFDMRLHGMEVGLPEQFESAGRDIGGRVYLIEGTRDEMIAAVKRAGYKVQEAAANA